MGMPQLWQNLCCFAMAFGFVGSGTIHRRLPNPRLIRTIPSLLTSGSFGNKAMTSVSFEKENRGWGWNEWGLLHLRANHWAASLKGQMPSRMLALLGGCKALFISL